MAIAALVARAPASAEVSASAAAPIRAAIDAGCHASQLAAENAKPIAHRVVLLERQPLESDAPSANPRYGLWSIVTAFTPNRGGTPNDDVVAILSGTELTYAIERSDVPSEDARSFSYCYRSDHLVRAGVKMANPPRFSSRVVYYDDSGDVIADSGSGPLDPSILAIPARSTTEYQPFHAALSAVFEDRAIVEPAVNAASASSPFIAEIDAACKEAEIDAQAGKPVRGRVVLLESKPIFLRRAQNGLLFGSWQPVAAFSATSGRIRNKDVVAVVTGGVLTYALYSPQGIALCYRSGLLVRARETIAGAASGDPGFTRVVYYDNGAPLYDSGLYMIDGRAEQTTVPEKPFSALEQYTYIDAGRQPYASALHKALSAP